MQPRRSFRSSSSSVSQPRGGGGGYSLPQASTGASSSRAEPRYSAPTSSSGSAAAARNRSRSQTSALYVPSSDLQRVHGMNRQLERINSRIEQKLQLYRQEAESSQFLLTRARRLTERLDVLKHKLRLCFDMCGTDHPPNLQLVLQQMQSYHETEPDDAPAEFMCPITQSVMIDPVRTSDGHCYDRAAIFEWFVGFEAKGQCPTSPLTNLILVDTTLTADAGLRQEIQSFLAAHREANGQQHQSEEPSLRLAPPAPPAVMASTPTAPQQPTAVVAGGRSAAATRPSGAPIWSSSVVPPNEANSRELNQLRMSDLEVPPPPGLIGVRIHMPTTSSSSSSMRLGGAREGGTTTSAQRRQPQPQQQPQFSFRATTTTQQQQQPLREPSESSSSEQLPSGGFRDQQRRLQEGLMARGLLPSSSFNATAIYPLPTEPSTTERRAPAVSTESTTAQRTPQQTLQEEPATATRSPARNLNQRHHRQ